MGIVSSIRRLVFTLGGLIEQNSERKSDALFSNPDGIRAAYQDSREKWMKLYAATRETIAQLLIALDKKKKAVESISEESAAIQIKLGGAVEEFKKTNDATYQRAFHDLFNRDKELLGKQSQLNAEIKEIQNNVGKYKVKLNEMQVRINELTQQEAEAIADIVSSEQIIKLNDRLSNLSTDLDDCNLRAIEDRRQSLKVQAQVSSEFAKLEKTDNLEEELLALGIQSEAEEVFAAMLEEEGEDQKIKEKEV